MREGLRGVERSPRRPLFSDTIEPGRGSQGFPSNFTLSSHDGSAIRVHVPSSGGPSSSSMPYTRILPSRSSPGLTSPSRLPSANPDITQFVLRPGKFITERAIPLTSASARRTLLAVSCQTRRHIDAADQRNPDEADGSGPVGGHDRHELRTGHRLID